MDQNQRSAVRRPLRCLAQAEGQDGGGHRERRAAEPGEWVPAHVEQHLADHWPERDAEIQRQ